MRATLYGLLVVVAIGGCGGDIGNSDVDGGVAGGADGAPGQPDAGPAGDDAAPQPACGWVRIVDLGGERLNVRAAPALTSEAVGELSEGMRAAVLETATGELVTDETLGRSSDDWFRIETAAASGWVTAVYALCTEAPVAGSCGESLPDTWVWPTPGNTNVVQPFGNPIQYQSCGFHTGVDITGGIGDPIVAVAAGEVVHVGPMWLSGAGQGRGPNAVIIHHGDDVYSTYGHNDVAHVTEGDCVEAGDLIADLGTLGYSSGPHLHFEMVSGTPFTGDWMTPFVGVCDDYEDPIDWVQP